jgi:hypothetical protein
MSIRAGRRAYKAQGYDDCHYPGYTKIKCLIMKDISKDEYGSISPYETKDKDGIIIENLWQFAKVYKEVPKTKESFSRFDKTVVWQHPKETHVDGNDKITPAYYAWRKKGMDNKLAVRYPVGKSREARASCLYALATQPDGSIDENEHLDYIQGRKKIYVPEFCKSLQNEPDFLQLKQRYQNGEKLVIIEVDGPHQESLDYYKTTYGVDDNFFVGGTVQVNVKNMKILLNDTKHPFGHGYCLAMELAGITDQVLKD